MTSQSNQFGTSDKTMKLSQYAYGALSVIDQLELVTTSMFKEMREAIVNSAEVEDATTEEGQTEGDDS